LKLLASLDVTYVPYSGGAPAITALLGGHVDSVLGNFSEAVEQLNAGKLRALAATTRTRIPPLPDVPTVAESGYKIMRPRSGSACPLRPRRRRRR
jgi:tripartite-type tricarboxylate transporter receptor subunit TctC